jgi:hypothetical protein
LHLSLPILPDIIPLPILKTTIQDVRSSFRTW